jgi:hypothetical protein
MSSDYRLSPRLAARLVGAGLVVLAVLVFATTAVAAVVGASPVAVIVVAAIGVAAVLVAGHLLTRRAYVVRLDDHGYRVRLVRGAGVNAAPWRDVEDAVTATPRGVRCVVLRLRDGRTTTIPVEVLAAEPDAFVRDVRAHLDGFTGGSTPRRS